MEDRLMRYHRWQRQRNNKARIREWCRRIPCAYTPGHVVDVARGLGPEVIAVSVLDYLFLHFLWTGIQGPGSEKIADSPLELLHWRDLHFGDNNGQGPTFACGPMSALFTGICGALDVDARGVWASSWKTGQKDYAAEYWTGKKWVLVVPHLGLRFMYNGELVDYYRFCELDREENSNLQPVGTSTGYQGQVRDPGSRGILPPGWITMGGNPHCRQSNRPHTGGHPLEPRDWNHLQLMRRYKNAVPYDDVDHTVFFGNFDLQQVFACPIVGD